MDVGRFEGFFFFDLGLVDGHVQTCRLLLIFFVNVYVDVYVYVYVYVIVCVCVYMYMYMRHGRDPQSSVTGRNLFLALDLRSFRASGSVVSSTALRSQRLHVAVKYIHGP